MTENHGLAAERQKNLLRLLKQHNVLRVDELCELLRASAATIRRDLADMDVRGLVKRVHGGAIAVESALDEQVFENKASTASSQKHAIAQEARTLIEPDSVVYLDGGSTVLTLARLLVDIPTLTVVTNSLRVAGTLSGHGPRLILIGGDLRRISQTFVGPLTRPLLQELSFDTAFMGTMGVSLDHGATTTDPAEAQTKNLVAARARRVVLLADSTKIGKVSFVKAHSIDEIDVLVTDSDVKKEHARAFQKKLELKLVKFNGTKKSTEKE